MLDFLLNMSHYFECFIKALISSFVVWIFKADLPFFTFISTSCCCSKRFYSSEKILPLQPRICPSMILALIRFHIIPTHTVFVFLFNLQLLNRWSIDNGKSFLSFRLFVLFQDFLRVLAIDRKQIILTFTFLNFLYSLNSIVLTIIELDPAFYFSIEIIIIILELKSKYAIWDHGMILYCSRLHVSLSPR